MSPCSASAVTVVRMTTQDEEWTVRQCAEYHGVQPSTWRAYVARRDRTGAPAPTGQLDGRTPLWSANEVRSWQRPAALSRCLRSRAVKAPSVKEN